jgi:hypothetical protein
MNCEWLQAESAFSCVPVRGLHGEEGIEIGTPFSFADGTAIVLYAIQQNEHILLSDNGEMIAHLSSVGLAPQNGKRLQVLRERVAPFGFTLSDQGDMRALVSRAQSRHMLSQAVTALLSVAEWEREQMNLDESTRNVADDAEIYLREWKPNAHLERFPKIKGQSKKIHTFDYLFDGEYIDVIAPNHTATGAAMRKAGDVKNSPYLEKRDIRIVVDDRRDFERAESERQILGSLVKAMLFTRLISLARPSTSH